jgi:hypothetical protein
MNVRAVGVFLLSVVACTNSGNNAGSSSDVSGNQANNASEEDALCDCSAASECTRIACGWCACKSSGSVCTRDNTCKALNANSANATDSVLQLTSVSTASYESLPALRAGKVRKTVRVMYNPPSGASSVTFRMADISVIVSKQVQLVGAFESDALKAAGKTLYVDPYTQKPWQKKEPSDGPTEFRVLILSMENPDYVKAGALYDLVFDIPEGGKAAFWFKDATSVLAPAGANSALRSTRTTFLNPLVVEL